MIKVTCPYCHGWPQQPAIIPYCRICEHPVEATLRAEVGGRTEMALSCGHDAPHALILMRFEQCLCQGRGYFFAEGQP